MTHYGMQRIAAHPEPSQRYGGNDTFNPNNRPIKAEYITAMLKGRPGEFALKV